MTSLQQAIAKAHSNNDKPLEIHLNDILAENRNIRFLFIIAVIET
jgi:hypothetical protein